MVSIITQNWRNQYRPAPPGTNRQQDWRSDGAQAAPGPDNNHALLGALGYGSGRKAWIALSLSMVFSVKTLFGTRGRAANVGCDDITSPADNCGTLTVSGAPHLLLCRLDGRQVLPQESPDPWGQLRDAYAPQGPSQRAMCSSGPGQAAERECQGEVSMPLGHASGGSGAHQPALESGHRQRLPWGREPGS
jgi:hypothetical protein